MKTRLSIRTICPIDVAEKLDAVRNFLMPEVADEIEKQPRLLEAMWFLQWVSLPQNFAGGLQRFVEEFLRFYGDQVGVESLLAKAGRKLTSKDIESVIEEVPYTLREELLPKRSKQVLSSLLDSDTVPLSASERREREDQRRREFEELDYATFHRVFLAVAKRELADALSRVCCSGSCGFFGPVGDFMNQLNNENRIWYFPRVWECLFSWMDAHADRVKGAFAETSITRDIFRWLELAQKSGKGVMFIGHSRHGKSVSIRSFAQMYPGRVRIVECPSTGSESDLLREIARALGIHFTTATPPLHEQRAAIDHVLRQGKFLLIFDEAQFLFPQTGTRRSTPPRLNYVRRSIMDIGVPTAFICTHQNWKDVEKNFLKVSAYSIEQFEGRLLRAPIHLVSELSEAEMIEVARIHFPDLSDDYLKIVVLPIRAFNGGDHLSSIENIAVIARDYAASAGRTKLCLDDIERATNDVLACGNFTPTGGGSSDSPKAPKLANRSIRPAGFGDRPSLRSDTKVPA